MYMYVLFWPCHLQQSTQEVSGGGGGRNMILPVIPRYLQLRQRCIYSLHMAKFLTEFALIPKTCEMVHLYVICTRCRTMKIHVYTCIIMSGSNNNTSYVVLKSKASQTLTAKNAVSAHTTCVSTSTHIYHT